MPSLRFTHLAPVLLSLLASANVQASTASVSVSNFQLRVIDLDPLDGIEAGITLTGGDAFAYAYVQVGSQGAVGLEQTAGAGEALGPVTYSSGPATASGQAFGGMLLGGPGLGFSASSAASWENSAYPISYSYSMAGSKPYHFELTPNTLLILTADVQPIQVFADLHDSASVRAELTLTSSDGSSIATSYITKLIYPNSGTFQRLGSQLIVPFANVSNTAATGDFSLFVFADSAASGVPEPGSPWLLAAGIAAMSLIFRRRASR